MRRTSSKIMANYSNGNNVTPENVLSAYAEQDMDMQESEIMSAMFEPRASDDDDEPVEILPNVVANRDNNIKTTSYFQLAKARRMFPSSNVIALNQQAMVMAPDEHAAAHDDETDSAMRLDSDI